MLWTRLVVVNELPVSRNTLLMRLLGAGAVLEQAINELKDMQLESPERRLALPILLRLRFTVPSDPAEQTRDDKEFLVNTEDIVDTWRREAVEEGVAQGVAQGLAQGMAHALIKVYEGRFGTMPDDLRALVNGTKDEATLTAWLVLASTRDESEIAAAIRASRVS